MTTIKNTDPNVTFGGLLTLGISGTGTSATASGVTASIQPVQDALGNSSALGLSSSQVNCSNFTFNGHTVNTIDLAAITITPAVTFSGVVTFNGTVTGLTITNPFTAGTFTVTLGGNFTTSGAFNTTLVATAATVATLPAGTGTLVSRTSTDTLTNKTLTSPVLTTPTLGVATATSLNGLSISTTTGTLAIGNGFTATINNNLSVTGAATISTTPITKVVRQYFASSGTYTPTPGMVECLVQAIGGGAGSGGKAAASNYAASGGGGAGTYAEKLYTAAQVGATAAVTIGTAGGGGSAGNNAGTDGGTTSFAASVSTMTAPGGTHSSGVPNATLGSLGGAGGGAATNADFYVQGQSGLNSFLGQTIMTSGAGGNSVWGAGGQSQIATNGAAAGTTATGHGAGGGGAVGYTDATAEPGASGTAGLVVITEWVAV